MKFTNINAKSHIAGNDAIPEARIKNESTEASSIIAGLTPAGRESALLASSLSPIGKQKSYLRSKHSFKTSDATESLREFRIKPEHRALTLVTRWDNSPRETTAQNNAYGEFMAKSIEKTAADITNKHITNLSDLWKRAQDARSQSFLSGKMIKSASELTDPVDQKFMKDLATPRKNVRVTTQIAKRYSYIQKALEKAAHGLFAHPVEGKENEWQSGDIHLSKNTDVYSTGPSYVLTIAPNGADLATKSHPPVVWDLYPSPENLSLKVNQKQVIKSTKVSVGRAYQQQAATWLDDDSDGDGLERLEDGASNTAPTDALLRNRDDSIEKNQVAEDEIEDSDDAASDLSDYSDLGDTTELLESDDEGKDPSTVRMFARALVNPSGDNVEFSDTPHFHVTEQAMHNALTATNDDDILKSAFEMYRNLTIATPDMRGTAAKAHYVLQSVLLAKGIDLPPAVPGLAPDLEAMTRTHTQWINDAPKIFGIKY